MANELVPSTAELIVVRQLPIIEEQLHSVKAAVESRVRFLLSLECTADTLQEVKTYRAELRRDLAAMEEKRKAVKTAVMEPYTKFEEVYKDCISTPMKKADEDLAKKISDTESGIKAKCEADLRRYFEELCQVAGIDFLRYEDAGISVDMASAKAKTPKKLREQLAAFVARVEQDTAAIVGMEYSTEIFAEYKRSLNLSGAIGTIQDRHRREAQAQEQAAAMAARREAARKVEETVQQVIAEETPAPAPEPVQAPVILETPAVVAVEEEPQPTAVPRYPAAFVVYGTIPMLKALKNFLEEGGYEYHDIDIPG